MIMITRSELLDVVYRFYPRGVLPYARIHVPPGEPSYEHAQDAGGIPRSSWRCSARKANPPAVWNDLLSKATRKAVLAGWYATREAVRGATAYAGLVARECIMWNPTSDGEWLVMTRTIRRTVRTLQASAVDLVERMAAVKSAAASVEARALEPRGRRVLRGK